MELELHGYRTSPGPCWYVAFTCHYILSHWCVSSGDLAKAIQNTSVHFGVYFSQFEWFNPLFLQDQANDFKTQIYPKVSHTVVITYNECVRSSIEYHNTAGS